MRRECQARADRWSCRSSNGPILGSTRERTAVGTVKSWRSDQGWGVLASPEVPEDVWAFFAMIDTGDADPSGYRTLDAGDRVEFRYQRGQQDGSSYVATWVRQLRVVGDEG